MINVRNLRPHLRVDNTQFLKLCGCCWEVHRAGTGQQYSCLTQIDLFVLCFQFSSSLLSFRQILHKTIICRPIIWIVVSLPCARGMSVSRHYWMRSFEQANLSIWASCYVGVSLGLCTLILNFLLPNITFCPRSSACFGNGIPDKVCFVWSLCVHLLQVAWGEGSVVCWHDTKLSQSMWLCL
jgi:hypothetical protein